MSANKNTILTENNEFTFKSAGRHLLTIGRDLIKDAYGAIVELVKNAYDADASSVTIDISVEDSEKIKFIIKDNGHGMTRDTVVNKWMVLSTEDKKNRKLSPKGRIMQGKKGIGRYAVSVLGNLLDLETVDATGKKTRVSLNWEDFEKAEYIENIKIFVSTDNADSAPYTKLTIEGNKTYLKPWIDRKYREKLILELRKLIAPLLNSQDKFEISLKEKGFDLLPLSIKIEPIDILDYFDYRISGTVDRDIVKLKYECFKKGIEENIDIQSLKFQESFFDIGKVTFDLRVYDRDTVSLEYLIGRFPSNEKKAFSTANQIKSFLDLFVGVGVYRNSFRIRPLGDSGYDWLKLDERRVQNPSLCVGFNQIIGSIHIESEEKSNLEEKSARDGLKENKAYEELIILTHNVLKELEDRRFKVRRSLDKKTKTAQDVNALYETSDLKRAVSKLVNDNNLRKQIEEVIDKDQEKKRRALDNLVQKIAIYQGQATLGKIMNVVLHEGRKPLNYFSNQAGNIIEYAELIKNNFSQSILENVVRIMNEISANSKLLSALFKRLDPLAAGNRGKKRKEKLLNMIGNCFKVYNETIKKVGITVKFECPEDLELYCLTGDIAIIFMNLIDNSVYWLEHGKHIDRQISLSVTEEEGKIIVDFMDNGPGISEENIESGIIFEPEYSTKPNGTGLGLALAGEAIERNNGKLEAYYSDKGAHFKLTFYKRL